MSKLNSKYDVCLTETGERRVLRSCEGGRWMDEQMLVEGSESATLLGAQLGVGGGGGG